MPLSGITVNIGSSGLGRRLLSDDGISGIVFYNDTPPSGFATENAQKVFSLEEAEALGIVDDNAAYEVDHYHVSEFFRINPSGSLWIGYYAVPGGAYDYDEVVQLQNSATGEIRIFGVYTPLLAFASAQVTALQAKMTELDTLNTPGVAYLAPDIDGTADLSTLTDLRTLNAPDVSVEIGEDNAGLGASLHTAKGYSITCVGARMGATSGALVSESIGNPEKFNLAGAQLTVPGYANEQAFRDLTLTASGAIKDKAYCILRDYLPGISGTYSERIPMCVPSNSDFAFQENRRVVQKTQRLMVAAYQPKLNSTVLLNSDGELSDFAVESLKDIGQTQIEAMQANGDISDGVIKIDPAQDILSTSELVISVDILPLGISEFITININLVAEITT